MNDAPITAAATKLDELLRTMGIEATIEVAPDAPVLNIVTDEPSRLIGHRGEVIAALQHLVRVFIVRSGVELPVVVDIDGYRDQQKEQLLTLAKRKADSVAETGRLAVLPPMSSYERRLIHTVVAEYDDLITESIGHGGDRRVMIKKK